MSKYEKNFHNVFPTPDIVPDIMKTEKYLGNIFEGQKKLMEHYIKLESIPSYPLNLNRKEDQRLIKDLASRVIEELAEAQEVYRKMVLLVEDNQIEEAIKLKADFNEEIADTLHFFIELLVFVSIEDYGIWEYYKNLLSKSNLTEAIGFGEKNHLRTMISFGYDFLIQNGYVSQEYRLEKTLDLKITDLNHLIGGNKVGLNHLEATHKFLWQVTYWLNISRNKLKNRDWSRKEIETKTQDFYTCLMEAWLAFFNFLAFMGFSYNSIYDIYMIKNHINLYRIENEL